MIYFQLKYPEEKEQNKTSWLPMQCFQLEKKTNLFTEGTETCKIKKKCI